MTEAPTCTAFLGNTLFAAGTPWDVALAIKHAALPEDGPALLIFDDRTGRAMDFDLRGSDQDVADRLRGTAEEPATDAGARARGRPKLGVVAREVTLLPRHWEWLAEQPEGASAVLRRLVDAARAEKAAAEGAKADRVRRARSAADRFMMAMLGNQPGWEEASRALYADDRARFHAFSEGWPADLRTYARRLAEPALAAD